MFQFLLLVEIAFLCFATVTNSNIFHTPNPSQSFIFVRLNSGVYSEHKKNRKENKINSIATYLSPVNSDISCRTCSWDSILLFCGNPLYINPTSHLVYMFVPWIKFKWNVRWIMHFDFKLYGQLKTRLAVCVQKRENQDHIFLLIIQYRTFETCCEYNMI